jgi:hypothetical protein
MKFKWDLLLVHVQSEQLMSSVAINGTRLMRWKWSAIIVETKKDDVANVFQNDYGQFYTKLHWKTDVVEMRTS